MASNLRITSNGSTVHVLRNGRTTYCGLTGDNLIEYTTASERRPLCGNCSWMAPNSSLPAVDNITLLVAPSTKAIEGMQNVKEPITASEELEAFKRQIYEKVMAYDQGCREGKIRFLKELEVMVPKKQVTISFELDDPDTSDNWETTIRNNIEYSLEGYDTYPENFQIDVVDGQAVPLNNQVAHVHVSRYLGKTAQGDAVHIVRGSLDANYHWSYCGNRMYPERLDDYWDTWLCSTCQSAAKYGPDRDLSRVPRTDAYGNHIVVPVREDT